MFLTGLILFLEFPFTTTSQCAAENIGQYCGANGECAQSDVDSNHVCSCPSDTWWTSGNGDDPNNFGDNADPCKPVLENWLIIVIGVFGFLLIVLIIICKFFTGITFDYFRVQ